MKHTMETDRASMLDRLADPTLLDAAVVVPVGETDGVVRCRLAVPVGGGRLAGYLTVEDYAEALTVLTMLDGRSGFPHVRVRETVAPRDSRRTIIWGEDPPESDALARWRFYGYSDKAVARVREGEQTSGHPPAGLDTN
ncbi:DUF6302 family protein [Streptomyces scopuliridis]|uniref:DUF6302 family protein n=1 Tax=Streptomyces scopuliridis TaxID=452529 RepID=UPI0036A61523